MILIESRIRRINYMANVQNFISNKFNMAYENF